MKFDKPVCDTCGHLACGTTEEVQGVAELDMNEDGTAEYTGTTEIHWDTQSTLRDPGTNECWLQCDNGHEWKSKMVET